MVEEIKAIERNRTWELVTLPLDKNPIDMTWIFNTKFRRGGFIAKHKVRLKAKGFLQKHGFNYTNVYALVVRLQTMRLVIVVTSFKTWKIC